MRRMPDTPVALAWKRLSRRFKTPLRTATGEHAARESLVVRVQLADGRVGFAEAASWPGFPVPSLDAVEQELRSVKREVGDSSATSSETRSRCALTPHTSHFLIRTALDWARLGWGDTDAARPCAALLRDAADAPARVAAGFTTLKRKIGVGADRVGGVARDGNEFVAACVCNAPGLRQGGRPDFIEFQPGFIAQAADRIIVEIVRNFPAFQLPELNDGLFLAFEVTIVMRLDGKLSHDFGIQRRRRIDFRRQFGGKGQGRRQQG